LLCARTERNNETETKSNKKHLKNVGPIRHCEPLQAHSPGVATVARRLRIDVHGNAWQRGALWPHRMGPKTQNSSKIWSKVCGINLREVSTIGMIFWKRLKLG